MVSDGSQRAGCWGNRGSKHSIPLRPLSDSARIVEISGRAPAMSRSRLKAAETKDRTLRIGKAQPRIVEFFPTASLRYDSLSTNGARVYGLLRIGLQASDQKHVEAQSAGRQFDSVPPQSRRVLPMCSVGIMCNPCA